MSFTQSQIHSLLDPEVSVNPYPFYKALRTETPIYWDEQAQAWLISRYADVTALLRDPRFTTEPLDAEWESRQQLIEISGEMMQFQAPAKHAYIRQLAEEAFLPIIPRAHQRTQQLINSLLDEVQGREHIDLIHDIFEPFPFLLITELIGIHVEDRDQFRQWVSNFASFAIATSQSPTTEEEDRQVLESLLAVKDFFSPTIEQRLKQPREDVITALTQVEIDGERLSLQQVVMNAVQLAFGGFVPVTGQVGLCLLSLLRYPEQAQKLRDNSALMESAIKECVRYDSLVQWVSRHAKEDVELHGHLIRKNQVVRLGLGSGNRDEARFPEPDRFDITRTDNAHIGYGFGAHECIGKILADIQMQAAVSIIFKRIKSLHLETEDIEFLATPTFRIPASLPVRVEFS